MFIAVLFYLFLLKKIQMFVICDIMIIGDHDGTNISY